MKNCYESEDNSVVDHLKYISDNIGPKNRTPAYNEKIDRLLRPPNKPKKGKKGRPKVVSTNNIDFTSPSLKLAEFSIGKFPVKALVDTGSTHCLMSVSTFRKLSGLNFYPLKIDMRVAGSVLHDNIVGSTTAVILFSSDNGEVEIPINFLIAHAINGYDAILGATILMNPEMIVAVTPTHLCLTEEYGNFSIKLENADRSVEGNHMHCEMIHIPPGVTKIVTARVSTPISAAPGSILEARANAGAGTILECILGNPVTVHCTVNKDEYSRDIHEPCIPYLLITINMINIFR